MASGRRLNGSRTPVENLEHGVIAGVPLEIGSRRMTERADLGLPSYSARREYLDPKLVERYEADRFSGLRGAYIWRREQRSVGRLVSAAGSVASILDCPSGSGRWQPLLASLAFVEPR